MTTKSNFGKIASITCAAITLLFSLSGCSNAESTRELGLVGYNHSGSSIGSYAVTVGNKRREGGYIGPGQGGASEICCVIVPKTWKPGMTATISVLNYDGKKFTTTEQVVTVPKYDGDRETMFSVHFLHDGRIKVFVDQYDLWHKDYPLKGKEAEMRPGEPVEVRN
jgi:hypothetical protein